MNNKDKEAFDNWIDNDVLSHDDNNKFKNMSEQERIIFVTERTWQAACEYKQKEYSNIMDAMTQTSQYNYKLQAENKKLREALEFYAEPWEL